MDTSEKLLRDGLLRGLRKGKTPPRLIDRIPDEEIEFWLTEWDEIARPEQRAPGGDWLTWLILGGRGAGKTRAGAEWVRGIATATPPRAERIALVGETFHDAREVMIEGVSGLLAIHTAGERPEWQASRRRLVWRNGVVAQAFSAEDPEALRGPQFAAAWADGIGHTAAAGPPRPMPGMTITRAEAFEILARDLRGYEGRVAGVLGTAAQHVFDGAVSFDFNTGAIGRASWVDAYRRGDNGDARARLMLWVKAGGRTIAGLVNRRKAEARLIFDGNYGDAGTPAADSDDVRVWQADLAALGYYAGAIDGIPGPATRAAVVAYQQSHPDLVVDGIVGRATRASLARDAAARKRLVEAGGAVVAASASAGGAAVAAGAGSPLPWALLAAAALAAVLGGLLVMRYRGELARLFLMDRRQS